jgi:hypothetical protein
LGCFSLSIAEIALPVERILEIGLDFFIASPNSGVLITRNCVNSRSVQVLEETQNIY